MTRTEVTAPVEGGALVGWRLGSGPPVLLLHGGPGMSAAYLDDLVPELSEGYEVAAFQQRGIAPSMTEGPFTVDVAISDVVAFLDALGWDQSYVLGHSWGGHLLFHVVVAAPERVLGALSVDPLGGVGDGGGAAFEAEMTARTPEVDRARAEELDRKAMAGEGSEDDVIESMRLYWSAYFADPEHVAPMPPMQNSVAAYAGLWEDLNARLPELAAALTQVRVPVGVVVGERSPIPPDQAGLATAAVIPDAWTDVVEGAGHFLWYERPGSVRAALDRLAGKG